MANSIFVATESEENTEAGNGSETENSGESSPATEKYENTETSNQDNSDNFLGNTPSKRI